MPDIYPAGKYIPEMDGTVQGGVTVVVHRPEDVDGLLALCKLADKPPEEPLGESQTPTLSSRSRGEIGGGSQSHVTRAPVRIPRLLEPRRGPHGSTTARCNRSRSRSSPALCIRRLPRTADRNGDASSLAGGKTAPRSPASSSCSACLATAMSAAA